MRNLAAYILLLLSVATMRGQVVNLRIDTLTTETANMLNPDSVRAQLDKGPYFTLYKDNYFIVGTDPTHKPTSRNSDVKFQVSISQRLTKSVLPFNTYLYLFYTQKVFWDVFRESMPIHDLNFNPGIGLARHLIVKNKVIGKVMLQIEHESNGRDGEESRSWNKISLGGNIFLDPHLMVFGKFWIPIIDGQNNKDILDYCGIFTTGVAMRTIDGRFGGAVILTKRRGWNLNYNTTIEFNWRFSKRSNQYFFIQYYNGYGECLLDYNKFRSRLRIGMCIKPRFFSDY